MFRRFNLRIKMAQFGESQIVFEIHCQPYLKIFQATLKFIAVRIFTKLEEPEHKDNSQDCFVI